MHALLLTEEQKKLRQEVRDLVKWVPRQMILGHGQWTLSNSTRSFLQEAGRRNLLGAAFAP